MPRLRLNPAWELGSLPTVASTELANADLGNYQTVEVMRKKAREQAQTPLVRKLALKILEQAGTRGHNFLDEARALGEFVKSNVSYVRDPTDVEQLHDPIFMINEITKGTARGDCDDKALLLATLLLSVGHQPYFAIVRYRDVAGPFNHIYVVEYDRNWGGPKQRLVMDTILEDRPIGTEVPHKSRREIRV